MTAAGMFIDYFTHNFITLTLLAFLAAALIINRRLAVPAAGYFIAGILTILLTTAVDSANLWLQEGVILKDSPQARYTFRIIITVLERSLRPLVLMILALIVLPDRKLRLPMSIPAIINFAVYSIVGFGPYADDLIDPYSPWHKGVVGLTVIYVLMIYLAALLLFSIIYFKWDEMKRSVIVFLMALQFIIVAIMNLFGLPNEYVNAVLAINILEYYFYLSVIYQHEIHDEITKRNLTIAKNKLSLLRSQMHPHFVINALSIIRALVKRDNEKAERGLEDFTDYLSVHINAIQTEDLIDFKTELRHVNAYLSLVQADRSRHIEVIYDLKITDFRLPPLSLEPLIENAVKYGTGIDDGVITISTEETPEAILIRVADNGTGDPAQPKKPESTGIGISNTRQRLAMICGGTLAADRTDSGMIVTITIPLKSEVTS